MTILSLSFQMVQEAAFISLGGLLEETAETDNDSRILERVKLLAQELLPEGWTAWKVTQLTREEIFGESVDPQVLNKLRFALPTDQLARAFVPEATRLSEKGFRDLKLKMLDWAFTRALITSPPAVCNKIRGSAAATELFNEAVRPEKPMSRKEADRALSMEVDGDPSNTRKRQRSSDAESCEVWATRSKRSRIDVLEQRMDSMFSTLMERIESLVPNRNERSRESSSEEIYSTDEENIPPVISRSETPHVWQAPPINSEIDLVQRNSSELDFLPAVKEAEPAIPAPSEQIRVEGIACQRFGSDAWNRIRYKEVAKKLQVAPVFSTLKTNSELSDLGVQSSGLLSKQDGVLGTIAHGLLCQRKALAEELKKLAAKFPAASAEFKALLSEGSDFKATSDDLLQYVCAHRAETIDLRRRSFKGKSEALSSVLQQIPPSDSHLFHEEKLANFIRDNGGTSRIFPSRFDRVPGRERQSFRRPFQQPKKRQQPDASRVQKPRNSAWQGRPTQSSTQRRKQPNGQPTNKWRGEKKEQRQQRRQY
jgi:hypothetical protein